MTSEHGEKKYYGKYNTLHNLGVSDYWLLVIDILIVRG